MRRVWIAFFLAPLMVILPFGMFALIAYPIMLAITLLCAVPLFFLLRRMQWLDWWHALLAGAGCGAIYVLLDAMALDMFSIDRIATAIDLFYLVLGAGIGILYWWIGIFRNAAFPYVSKRFPTIFLLVVLLIFVVAIFH